MRKKETYDVTGMSCSACSSHVEKAVSKLEGIDKVTVNLLTNSMQVEYDENQLWCQSAAGNRQQRTTHPADRETG